MVLSLTSPINPLTCSPCKLLFTLITQISLTRPTVILEEVISLVCYLAKIEKTYTVCRGAVISMGSEVVQSLWDHYTEPDFICPLLNLCEPVYENINI